jgi:hypothetical protein
MLTLDKATSTTLSVQSRYEGHSTWGLFATPKDEVEGLRIVEFMNELSPAMGSPATFRLVVTEITMYSPQDRL